MHAGSLVVGPVGLWAASTGPPGVRTARHGLTRRCGETPQYIPHAREYHRVHDSLAKIYDREVRWSIHNIHQIALSFDRDVVDTRMPCQGMAHIQHSEAAEESVDL